MFQGKWREAAESFQDVLDLQPDNMAVSHPLVHIVHGHIDTVHFVGIM